MCSNMLSDSSKHGCIMVIIAWADCLYLLKIFGLSCCNGLGIRTLLDIVLSPLCTRWNLNSGALWLKSAELGDITCMVFSRGKRLNVMNQLQILPQAFIIVFHNLLPADLILYQLKCNCNMNMASYSKIAMSRVWIEYKQLSTVCLTSKWTLIILHHYANTHRKGPINDAQLTVMLMCINMYMCEFPSKQFSKHSFICLFSFAYSNIIWHCS